MGRRPKAKVTFEPPARRLITTEEAFEAQLADKRRKLIGILERRGIALSDDDRAQVQACRDRVVLDGWISNARLAKSTSGVFM